MYTLLMGLWSMLFAKVQYQILILGLDDAGKTTFLEQLKHLYSGSSPPSSLKIPPTVGLNLGKVELNRVRFLFWDLGGQASLRVLWDKYFTESHAVIWILDSTDSTRLHEVSSEIEKIHADKDLIDAPILILANKQDLKSALQVGTIAKLLKLPDSALTPLGMTHTNGSSVLTSSSVSSSSSFSSSSITSPHSASTPLTPPATPLSTTEHILRVLPISALNGEGISKVMDLLMDILPKSRRTMRMSEKL